MKNQKWIDPVNAFAVTFHKNAQVSLRPQYGMPILEVTFTQAACGDDFHKTAQNFVTHLRDKFSRESGMIHVCEESRYQNTIAHVHVLNSASENHPLLSAK